jgi:hypothetical protein
LWIDSIPVDLFLPRDQSVLNGSLSFCKQDQVDTHDPNRLSLGSTLTPSPAFDNAIDELLCRELIMQNNRVYSIHPFVQEAINHYDEDHLQDSFNIASRLTFEVFPKLVKNMPLFKHWATCQTYIPHGVFLSRQFASHARSGTLKSTLEFVELLNSCAWYDYFSNGGLIS